MTDQTTTQRVNAEGTAFAVILAVSFCHFLNDVMQSLLSSIYPLLKDGFGLAFWQIGLLTLTFQVTASLLQPLIGFYTDKKPMPYSLPVAMGSTFLGLITLALANQYLFLLAGAAMIGIGSAIFHPEASRVARLASGGRFGLAQSVFQVGGNFGTAIGPILAAFIVVPRGQDSVAWFSGMAFVGMVVLWQVSGWYARYQIASARKPTQPVTASLPRNRVAWAIVILAFLMFAKHAYTACLSSYYTFYVIERFGLSVQESQLMLFLFLGAMAVGTVAGGPIGDRIGAKTVIWFSILGVLPFTLALPYADLMWTGILTVIIGVILASAFPAIVVFAQELVPGRVGMIAGVFFGLAFGLGGLSAAGLGVLADWYGIMWVYKICSYLPFLGLLAIFLPDVRKLRAAQAA